MNADKQICNVLDRLHAERTRAPCRWGYNSRQNVYFCRHMIIPGRVVVGGINPIFTEAL